MSPRRSKILYYLVIIPMSRLPFSFIYLLSDFSYFMLYRVIGYRKEHVRKNLKKSFPERSAKDLKRVEKDFYKQFCDNILEGLKGLTIPQEEIKKRMVCRNPELLDKYYDQGKSVIITTAHYYSWEWWFLGIDMPTKHKIVLIYKQLSNVFFEEKLFSIRESFGSVPVEFNNIRSFFSNEENGTYGYIFGSDQAPLEPKRSYWVNFLNQETPVAFGAEKFAVDLDIPVVFCRIKPRKRGYYEFEFVDVEANPKDTEYGDITKAYTQVIEDTIKEDPAGWLWSHKRWKRQRPEGMPIYDLK